MLTVLLKRLSHANSQATSTPTEHDSRLTGKESSLLIFENDLICIGVVLDYSTPTARCRFLEKNAFFWRKLHYFSIRYYGKMVWDLAHLSSEFLGIFSAKSFSMKKTSGQPLL